MANLAHLASNLFVLAIPGESDLCQSVYKPLVLLDDADSKSRQEMACLAQPETQVEWQFLDIELTCPPEEILPSLITLRTKTASIVT